MSLIGVQMLTLVPVPSDMTKCKRHQDDRGEVENTMEEGVFQKSSGGVIYTFSEKTMFFKAGKNGLEVAEHQLNRLCS